MGKMFVCMCVYACITCLYLYICVFVRVYVDEQEWNGVWRWWEGEVG